MTSSQELSNLIWTTADDILRGIIKEHDYGDVILPFVVLRRLDCVLESKKDVVVTLWEEWRKKVPDPSPIILSETGLHFFNYSKFDLRRLSQDPTNLRRNFDKYLRSFSSNLLEIVTNFKI